MTLDAAFQSAIQALQQGNLPVASQILEQLYHQAANDSNVCYALGVTRFRQGKLEEAATLVHKAIQIGPPLDPRHITMAQIMQGLQRYNDAIFWFEKYVNTRPQDPVALLEYANLLSQAKRYDAAITVLKFILQKQPQNKDAWIKLGVAAKFSKQTDLALHAFQQVTKLDPHDPNHHSNLGTIYRDRKEYPQALACYEQSLKLEPNHADVLNNMGNVLTDCDNLEAAEQCFNRAVALKPNQPNALSNLANVHRYCGRFDTALQLFNRSMAVNPHDVDTRLHRSLVLLIQGNCREGWSEYEWRWQQKKPHAQFAHSWWNGEPLQGKTIFLWLEQGLGDTLQFIRYVPLLKQMGAKVIAHVQPSLIPLLQCMTEIDVLAPDSAPPAQFDYQLPLMSLPRVLQTQLDTIPNKVPYLSVNAARRAHWKQQLSSIPGFRIGIVWQGNPDYFQDRHRSFPLEHFSAIAKIPGVSLISLQFGHGIEQLQNPDLGFRVHELPNRDVDVPFLDTAAILQNLDLVISSDTSLVHLAGALAVPTWVALGVSPNWRWYLNRSDSPWYPTMKLYRQQERFGWPAVFDRIANDLQMLVKSKTYS